jgi:CheY-like chemotaxis protein
MIKIGIAEDEGIVAMDLSRCLTDLGYEVVFIEDNGNHVLSSYEKHKPDLLLMDIELKGDINGLNAAKKIKEKYNVKIIFLTAFEDESTLNKISAISSDGFIVKPFEDEELDKVLKKVLCN